MRVLVACVLLLGCREKEGVTEPPAPPPVPPRPAANPFRVVFGDQVFEPAHAIAYTRGGEAVVLSLSSHELACGHGRDVPERVGERTVVFELTRPLYEGSMLAPAPRWRLTGTSLLDYRLSVNSNMLSEDPAAVVEVPDDLATRGGRIRLRYRGERRLYITGEDSATPKPVSVEGEIAVRGCGDRPEVPLTEPMPIEVTIGTRRFPIRGALATRREGRDDIVLSSLPRTCDESGRQPGDLSINFRETDPAHTNPRYIALGGTLARRAPTYKDASTRTPARIPAKGPFELVIDMDATATTPIAIHGRVTAQRCKDR